LDEIQAIVERRRQRRRRAAQRTIAAAAIVGAGFAVIRTGTSTGTGQVASTQPTELTVPFRDTSIPGRSCDAGGDASSQAWLEDAVTAYYGPRGDDPAAQSQLEAIAADWGVRPIEAKAVFAAADARGITPQTGTVDDLIAQFATSDQRFEEAFAIADDWQFSPSTVKALVALGQPEALAAIESC
jgi:hypothetical protein